MDHKYHKYKSKYLDAKNMIIIKKRDFNNLNQLKSRLYQFLERMNIKPPVFIFDIHNTIEYDNGKIDKDISNFIEKELKESSVFFLSFDGKEERIMRNANILNSYSATLRKIPKIFIKLREKGLIIKLIYDFMIEKKLISEDKYSIVFIDDKQHNIEDAKSKLNSNQIIVFNYSKHSKHNRRYDDFNEIYKLI